MYYDQYTQAIYNWLVNNNIAQKITDLLGYAARITSAIEDLLPVVISFLFIYFSFQFIRKRWLNV